VFTARYALGPYIKQIRFVFKGLIMSVIVMKVLSLQVKVKFGSSKEDGRVDKTKGQGRRKYFYLRCGRKASIY
jgi:hypothetical protein